MNARAASVLLALMAASEMAVGILLAALPSIGGVLIGAPLDSATGHLIARMMGVAVLVIGLTWWLARGETTRNARIVPGFLIYNLGIGALFALAAMRAPHPFVPWVVAAAHVASGSTFAILVATVPSLRSPSP